MKNSVQVRWFFLGVALLLTVSSEIGYTKDAVLTGASEEDKKTIAAQINALKQQEIRILVLQKLMSEQSAILSSAQAKFCEIYKLDVDKMRKGLYTYDDKTGQFKENQEAPSDSKPQQALAAKKGKS